MEAYSTSEAAKRAGIAASSARNYTRDERLRPFFSPSAAPGSSKTARQFTPDDVKVLRFIGEQSALGATLDAIAASLQRGMPDEAQEAPQQPTDGPRAPQQQEAEQTFALVALNVLQQQHSQLLDALREAEQRAARAEAQLAAIEAERSKSFWARLFRR